MKFPTPQNLEVAFRREMNAQLEPAQILEIIQLNDAEANPNICHSHDFCDANEVMLAAWEAETGEPCEFDAGCERTVSIMNEAWRLAKQARFTDPDEMETPFTDPRA